MEILDMVAQAVCLEEVEVQEVPHPLLRVEMVVLGNSSYGVSGYFGGGGGGGKPSGGSILGAGGSGGGGAGGTTHGTALSTVNGTSGTASTGGGGGGMSEPSGYDTANGPGSGGSGFIGIRIGGAGIVATGEVIGIASVPSSAQTKVSGVMLYKDAYGSSTPGTQLKIYFTCNGGTNWTESASYTAVTPVFSTGIKMVRLGETTCTSGSDVRYKAVWASQVESTMEQQLHGIGLNY